MIIINWANGVQRCNSMRLQPILEEVLLLKQNFDSCSIIHVYREGNRVVDHLSKEGWELPEGQLQVEACYLDGLRGFYHRPFQEDGGTLAQVN